MFVEGALCLFPGFSGRFRAVVCSITTKQCFGIPVPSAAVKLSTPTKILLAWKGCGKLLLKKKKKRRRK